MSLAGLDTPAVVAARQASLAEPSGWFLLKYVAGSRDTIELLQRGSNGVAETKGVIESYQEKSPLYGMIHFRRRKIVLKYVPDGTSRVLQVRLAVQFQSVLDTFTPHDTLFSFTTASELSESSLALAIMMLPSIGSTSSNSSDRRRRLDEISEVVEDAPEKATVDEPEIIASPVQRPIQETSSHDLDELPASALRARALLSRRKDADSSPEPPPPVEPAQPTLEETTPEPAPAPAKKEPLAISVPPPVASAVIEKDLPAIPNPSPPLGSGPTPSAFPVPPSGASRTAELLAVLEPSRAPLTSASLDHSRHLSATDSDSIQEWSNTVASFNAVKPKKKKLAPRPHVEGPSRPRTSGNSEAAVLTRPVANMPSSVRITTNRPTTSATNYRPVSQQSSRSVPGRFPPPESSVHIMPPLPSPTHVASMYRPASRASRGMSTSIPGETANATPEKMRLMRALQLRKRNQLVTQRNSNSTGASTHTMNESQAGANNNLAEPVTSRTLITPSTASPTTMNNASEAHSKASSFTSREDADKRRVSISSDTSSSVTPKAGTEVERKKKSPKKTVTEQSSETLNGFRALKAENEIRDSEIEAEQPVEDLKESNEEKVAPAAPITDNRSLHPEGQKAKDTLSRGTSLSSTASRKRRGRPVPEHLAIVSSGDISELSEEESLMDELENAEVQEAMPVSVGRTPVTPVMSKISMFRDTNRSVSTPMEKTRPLVQVRTQSQPRTGTQSSESLDKPKSAGGRSISTALPNWPPLPAEPLPLTTKSTVGSGISRRIKALEGFTARQSTSPPRQPVKSEPSTRFAFTKFMKRSSQILEGPQIPNTSTENSPPKRLPDPPSTMKELPPQPWVQRQGQSTQVYHPTNKGETVSVTARIIRDETEGVKPHQSEFGDISLFQSPLIVERERQTDDHSGSKRSIKTAESKSPEREPRFSLSSQRLHTSDSFASKLSITGAGRKHLPKSASDNSSITDDKSKASRAGRLMKRVSNLAVIRRNPKSSSSIKSPKSASNLDFHQHPQHHHDTIEERAEPDNYDRPSISESLLHVVDIGDVNVQFPESLLWKRRFIRIDDQGFLIFSPPANETNSRAVSRKFHLNDFRAPVLPDPETEEMAWSIIMDLKDGRSLQYGCESRAAQNHVLQMLMDAHGAYQQLYG